MENRANEEFNKYVAEHKDQERHTPKAVFLSCGLLLRSFFDSAIKIVRLYE